MGYQDGWGPYVSVAMRRQHAAKKIAKLKKSGRQIDPVEIEGRNIARTFWGESWCKNLEAYSDYSNRLPRGRTYVRNGSVIDLQIDSGRVRALVSGSRLYNVDIGITPLTKKRWGAIKSQCGGKIDSIVELLRGSISKGVMEIVTRHGEGLFPAPKEISLSCSCPDWARMCKHVAATLYGVGARLDHQPEMLFTLRGVEPAELIAAAAIDLSTTRKSGRGRRLRGDEVSSVFGIDLDQGTEPGGEGVPQPKPRGSKKAAPKTSTKKVTTRAKKATTVRKRPPASRAKATKKSLSAAVVGKTEPATTPRTRPKAKTARKFAATKPKKAAAKNTSPKANSRKKAAAPRSRKRP